jgi:hypothetical protein
MALSELQVNVLRTVAIAHAVPVSVLVAYQQEETGARRTVARAALSRSLRRLWRLGANYAAGVPRSPWGILTRWLTSQTHLRRSVRRLVWWHLAYSSTPASDPIPTRVYVQSVAITSVGRDILEAAEEGRFPVWAVNA